MNVLDQKKEMCLSFDTPPSKADNKIVQSFLIILIFLVYYYSLVDTPILSRIICNWAAVLSIVVLAISR